MGTRSYHGRNNSSLVKSSDDNCKLEVAQLKDKMKKIRELQVNSIYHFNNHKKPTTQTATPVQAAREELTADVTDSKAVKRASGHNSALGTFADPATIKSVRSQVRTSQKSRPLGSFLNETTSPKEDYGQQSITVDQQMRKMKSVSITKPTLSMMNRFEHKRNQSID